MVYHLVVGFFSAIRRISQFLFLKHDISKNGALEKYVSRFAHWYVKHGFHS